MVYLKGEAAVKAQETKAKADFEAAHPGKALVGTEGTNFSETSKGELGITMHTSAGNGGVGVEQGTNKYVVVSANREEMVYLKGEAAVKAQETKAKADFEAAHPGKALVGTEGTNFSETSKGELGITMHTSAGNVVLGVEQGTNKYVVVSARGGVMVYLKAEAAVKAQETKAKADFEAAHPGKAFATRRSSDLSETSKGELGITMHTSA